MTEHQGPPDSWSYACQCVRCRWEQWWHEGDNSVIEIPSVPHPDGEYGSYFRDREFWSGLRHPNDGAQA